MLPGFEAIVGLLRSFVETILPMYVIGMADIFGINANLLVAMHALITEGSVTHAARRVGITQSAMSGALAQLRDLFDDPLLVRVGNRMQLTPRAEQLAPHVQAGVSAFQAALAGPIAFDPRRSQERFSLAMTDATELLLLPRLLTRLAELAPHVTLQVVHWGRFEPLPELATGEVDVMVGICDEKRLSAQHHQQPLYDDRFVCIVRRGHPRVGRRLTLATYAALGHVLVTEKPGSDGVVDAALRRLGKSRRIEVRVPHYLLVPRLVAHSDLVAAVDSAVAQRFAAELPLALFEPPLELPRATFRMIWHERTDRDPARRWLRDLLADGARGLPAVEP